MALIEIDGLPLKNGWIVPWQTVSHNQILYISYQWVAPPMISESLGSSQLRNLRELHKDLYLPGAGPVVGCHGMWWREPPCAMTGWWWLEHEWIIVV